MLRTTFLLVGITLAHFGFSQTFQLKVMDENTGKPLVAAHITPVDSGTGATTDENGLASLQDVEPGQSILVSFLGYERKVLKIKVPADTMFVYLHPDPLLLNYDIVVTANRQSTEEFQSIESVSVLNRRELFQQSARTTPEALIGVTGVWVQKTNHGGGSPFMRGLTGNQTLLLMDGIRLNNSTYRYGPNQYFNTIDVMGLERIEAVRGAGSVLYGSDALGGAIQLFTKTPAFSANGWKWRKNLSTKIATQDMEKSGRVELEGSGRRTAFIAGLTYRDFGDLVAGKGLGKEAPSAYQEWAGDFKSLMQLNKATKLTLAYNGVFQSNVGRYDQVAQRGFSLWQFDPQTRQMAYAKLEWEPQSRLIKKIQFTPAYQYSVEGRIFQKNGSLVQRKEEDKVTTWSGVGEAILEPRPWWTINTGLEWYGDKVNSLSQDFNTENNSVKNLRGLYPDDSKSNSFAAFMAHSFPLKSWTIQAGLRYNLVHMLIEDGVFGNTDITPDALVGHLAARWEINPANALTASVNSGFRAPNLNDMSTFGSFDFGIETPSPGLSPEKTFTLEMGYKRRGKILTGNINLYLTRLTNLITRVKSTFNGQAQYNGEDVYQKKNVAEANLWGIESDWSYNLSSVWNVMGSINYTYGQNTTDQEPMRRIPPLNGRIAMNYRPTPAWLLQLENVYAGDQNRLAAGDKSDHRINPGGTPGWNVFNLRLSRTLGVFTLQAGIQNIFNQAYRIHGSGVDGVGQSGWLAISVEW